MNRLETQEQHKNQNKRWKDEEHIKNSKLPIENRNWDEEMRLRWLKTAGMEFGVAHATWWWISKMSEGSRHLKHSKSSQDETKLRDQNLTQFSLQMSRVSLYQLSNSAFKRAQPLYLY